MNLNSHRWLLVAAACSLLAGCSTIISRDAYYTSNPNVIRLRDRAAAVQAKAAKNQLSWAESEKFLHESMGVAEVLRGMEGWGRGDQGRTASIQRFETRLKSLLARGKPLRNADTIDLGADIQQLDNQFRGQWQPSTDASDESSATSESTTDSTTTCETDKDKKDKDKKRDRDGRRDRDDKKRDRDHCEDDKKSDRR